MPLRLALMVAIGALLALGACSSDTKTVTRTEPAPAAPDPDPDPDPTPPVATTLTLPAGAADEFPAGDTNITIRSTDPEDGNGNRFVDRFGYRFVCLGGDACIVTVTKGADGMLSVETSGMVQRGEAPAVTIPTARTRFLAPAPGSENMRQQFFLMAGMSRSQNGVAMNCPAASAAGCTVIIETRTQGTGGTATTTTDVAATGGVTFTSGYPDFYQGLAYYRATEARDGDDPLSLSMALPTTGSGRTEEAGNGRTTAWLRRPAMSEDAAPATFDNNDPVTPGDPSDDQPASIWGGDANIEQEVTVDHGTPSEDSNNVFAGFAEGTSEANMARHYGAAAVRRGLGVIVTAVSDDIADDPTSIGADLRPGYVHSSLNWVAELPVDRTTASDGTKSFPFAGSDMRSVADRWSQGYVKTMALGDDTANDMSDDGTLHVQAFTNYEIDGTAEPGGTFGDINTGGANGAITGTVLVATGGSVPAAAPDSQTITGSSTPGTFNGVPGVWACTTTCTVATASSGAQTLSGGGALTFTPTDGARVVAGDSDWLAIGSWAVEMDSGHTVVGAFFNGGDPFSTSQAANMGLRNLRGEATYDGIARGHYAEHNDGARDAGVFSATTKFVVDFGTTTSDSGSGIYGMLRNFSTTSHGAAMAESRSAWEINYGSEDSKVVLDYSSNHVFGFGGPISGKWGSESDNRLAGAIDMRFFGPDNAAGVHPTGLAGSFVVNSATNDDHYDLRMIGALAAERTAQ